MSACFHASYDMFILFVLLFSFAVVQVTQFKKLVLECGSDPMSSSSRLPLKWQYEDL